MEEKYNKRGNLVINSGFKGFDKATNCLMLGNCIANLMLGWYIRSFEQTECNGCHNPKGHLMNYDLQMFQQYGINTKWVENFIKKNGKSILTMLNTNRSQKRDPFAFIIQTVDGKAVSRLYPKGWSLKREMAVDYFLTFVKKG